MIKSKINLLIVGGCFPVQRNIPIERLYHSILKEKLEKEQSILIETNILQYEKLNPTLKRIEEIVNQKKIDLIIFHIRIEQILRMIKFYLRYHDTNEVYHKGLNFAIFGNCIPERKEFNLQRTSENNRQNKKKSSNRFLQNINYILGYLVFNQVISFWSYKKLIKSIVKLCNSKSIELIFTGPVSRPVSFIENLTSMILHFYMKKLIVNKLNKTYQNFLGTNENLQSLFCDDNIRVNEIGHKKIANMLFNQIKTLKK